ncbi:ankyrin repeat domain-containing protein [Treponema bryantii]|uniref:ankyrin repeat domain-containing protein n=1 Tax=Treponema bryantii TaxID=163 RepID=UPI002B2BBBF2|nr:hypothetical protein TRBR_17420 [Treponema bryantii]
MSDQKYIINILRNDEMVRSIKKNDLHKIKKLVVSGYSVNNNIVSGITPLMIAAGLNCYKSAKKLISLGAKIDITDDKQQTVLMYCIPGNSLRIAKLLISKNKIDINSKTVYGWNVLMLAIYFKTKNIIKLLLDSNADPNTCLEDGISALEFSIEKNKDDKSISNLLIDYGARL